jgi:hypothetical protein
LRFGFLPGVGFAGFGGFGGFSLWHKLNPGFL